MPKLAPPPSPFDDEPIKPTDEPTHQQPGPGQFSIAVILLVMFDVAFIFAWWANSTSHTYFGEEMGEYTNRVIGSTLRLGIVFFPFWAFALGFLPALTGAALGSTGLADVDRRRKLRGASMFWTLISGMVIETLVRLVILCISSNGDGKLLWLALGNLGWGGLVLIVYLAYMAMIGAGYGLLTSLILSLLGRWKMIPLAAPWKDAPWGAMWNLGLYGPYIWLVGFLIWELAGKPELLAV
jgi:hypothetical protein